MCQACEEMDLFYAYLDQVEEEKRRNQPWQCEVTLLPQSDEPSPAQPRKAQPSASSKFVCDGPE